MTFNIPCNDTEHLSTIDSSTMMKDESCARLCCVTYSRGTLFVHHFWFPYSFDDDYDNDTHDYAKRLGQARLNSARDRQMVVINSCHDLRCQESHHRNHLPFAPKTASSIAFHPVSGDQSPQTLTRSLLPPSSGSSKNSLSVKSPR